MRWTIVLNLGRDPATGKRKQKWVTVRGTKRVAEKKLSELQNQLDTGHYAEPSKLTVAEHLRDWLHDYAATTVRPRTYEGYAMIVEKHLIPGLGAITLGQLQPAQIQKYYAKALDSGRSDGNGGNTRVISFNDTVSADALLP